MDESKEDRLGRAKRIVEYYRKLEKTQRKLVNNLHLFGGERDKNPEIIDLEKKAERESTQLKELKHGTKYLPEEDDWIILCLELLLDINSKVDQEE